MLPTFPLSHLCIFSCPIVCQLAALLLVKPAESRLSIITTQKGRKRHQTTAEIDKDEYKEDKEWAVNLAGAKYDIGPKIQDHNKAETFYITGISTTKITADEWNRSITEATLLSDKEIDESMGGEQMLWVGIMPPWEISSSLIRVAQAKLAEGVPYQMSALKVVVCLKNNPQLRCYVLIRPSENGLWKSKIVDLDLVFFFKEYTSTLNNKVDRQNQTNALIRRRIQFLNPENEDHDYTNTVDTPITTTSITGHRYLPLEPKISLANKLELAMSIYAIHRNVSVLEDFQKQLYECYPDEKWALSATNIACHKFLEYDKSFEEEDEASMINEGTVR